MCNGEDEKPVASAIFFDAVDDAVGESCHQVPSNLAKHRPTGSGMASETAERLLDGVQEDLSEPRGLRIVERGRFEELALGQWVPRDLGHLRRDRASWMTSSDGIARTAPDLISW